jgi:hypothetical protein
VKTTLLKIALLLLGVVALHSGAAAQATSAKVVLELFTGQGCSSCPPAAKLYYGISTTVTCTLREGRRSAEGITLAGTHTPDGRS